MAETNEKLTAAVENYLDDLCKIRSSGGATGERSYYPPLTNLLNAVGSTLKPKVFCVSELAQQGAGHPDLGLYAAKQMQRGRQRNGQLPEGGVVEVKPVGDDAWLTADGDQVSRYWDRYRLVLVTNTRGFVLLGEDAQGHPAKLETFRLAGSAAFESKLQHPRTFANDVMRKVPPVGGDQNPLEKRTSRDPFSSRLERALRTVLRSELQLRIGVRCRRRPHGGRAAAGQGNPLGPGLPIYLPQRLA